MFSVMFNIIYDSVFEFVSRIVRSTQTPSDALGQIILTLRQAQWPEAPPRSGTVHELPQLTFHWIRFGGSNKGPGARCL